MFVRHTVDDIDLEREIITKHGGRITDISYYIPEFKERLDKIQKAMGKSKWYMAVLAFLSVFFGFF